jgi:CRISPR-associated endoribonuclease Cas6
MRLLITLEVNRAISIPVNHQEYLTAAIYGYVGAGDQDYARFVHDDGYAAEGGKKFKPFTHSWLRVSAGRRRISGDRLQILPGPVQWQVSSPLDDFLRPFATGLLKTGSLRIGSETLGIAAVEALGTPELAGKMQQFTCLSPIVATARRADDTTLYLRPADDTAAFSEAIRKNMIAKYRAFTGREPTGTDLVLEFDPAYIQANHGGTKKATYKGINVIGILAPFTVTGSQELIKLGYEAGFGGKTACGFGCVGLRDGKS